MTLSVNEAGEVGKDLTFTGKVSPTAKGKTVTLQRKYPGGSWKTIASDQLSSSSTYSVTVEPSKAGPNSYRVRKAAQGSVLAAVSPTRNVTVYRWRSALDLPANFPTNVSTTNTATIRGRVFPRSVVVTGAGGMSFTMSDLCTKLTVVLGVDDTSSQSTGSGYFNATSGSGGQTPNSTPVNKGGFGVYMTTEDQLTSQLSLDFRGNSAADGKGVFGTPKVYCAS